MIVPPRGHAKGLCHQRPRLERPLPVMVERGRLRDKEPLMMLSQ